VPLSSNRYARTNAKLRSGTHDSLSNTNLIALGDASSARRSSFFSARTSAASPHLER
jgi:hypothetical protein